MCWAESELRFQIALMCSDKCVEEGAFAAIQNHGCESTCGVWSSGDRKKYPQATLIELALFRNFVAARSVTES